MNNVIKIKQLNLIYSHFPFSILTGYIAFGFITYSLWDHLNHTYFLYWIISFNLIMLYRIVNLLFYKRRELNSGNYNLFYQLNLFGTLMTGVIWGALTFFYSSVWQVEIQISLWVVVLALMSGASVSFSVMLKYFAAYVMPIFMLSMLILFATEHYYLAGVLVFYTLLLSITAFNFNKQQNLIISHQCMLEQSNTELKSLASRDSLTNLPNRRAFDDYLKKEWARHVRSKQEMSLIMIDVDYFKRYNDHYGHSEGDKCLKIIANVMQQSLHRPSDMAARYGGEEFTILLPETPTKGAIEVSERIHEKLLSEKYSS